MPRSSNKRTNASEKAADALSRAELAAEFLKRNRSYRAEHAQMEQRIARGSIARQTAEAAFARRWGLSFRLCAGRPF
jgi:hypothetical protein